MTKVEADFNGDGKPDQAVVLLHKEDTNRAGVFVFSNGATKASSIKKLGEYQFSEGEFMLSAVNKGCYRSEKRTVCLRYSGVLRTEIEYGWGTLYWQGGRRLTLPSRGCSKGCAFCAPLMSNVSPQEHDASRRR